MKLTEAQLKRIIEEEVQAAIDEGILDMARKVGGAISGAAKVGAGAIKQAGASLAAGARAGAAEAEAANVQRQQTAMFQQTSGAVNKLGEMFEKIKASPGGKDAIGDHLILLSRIAGIDLASLASKARSAEEIGKKELASAPQSKGRYDPTGANPTRDITAKAEAKIHGITEAIMKRISQKR
jgi:hypothetical protein